MGSDNVLDLYKITSFSNEARMKNETGKFWIYTKLHHSQTQESIRKTKIRFGSIQNYIILKLTASPSNWSVSFEAIRNHIILKLHPGSTHRKGCFGTIRIYIILKQYNCYFSKCDCFGTIRICIIHKQFLAFFELFWNY